jgi:two-component system, OmpR family, phosphate regulon response regulator PhoB
MQLKVITYRYQMLTPLFTTTAMTGPVLIIEDNADIAEVLQYVLENEKLKTRVALTGEEGLIASLDETNAPSIILLDLLLPGMSGIELCRRLRREPLTRNTPIIVVTARASEEDREASLRSGADDYIIKPFSVRDVIARINRLLQRRPEYM